MKAQLVAKGSAVDHTPNADVAAGEIIVVGSDLRIAHLDMPAGRMGALHVDNNLYSIQHGADEIADGAIVYWDADGDPVNGDAGTGCATATALGNTPIGFAVGAVGAAAERVIVRRACIGSVTNAISGGLANAIADPGNAGAIPVTATGCVDLVTAGAETRTIAAPSFRGQQMNIGMKTDGGDCVITVATGINQAANTTITFNDAGDSIQLVAIQVGANLRWRVVYNDGCTLG